VTRVPPLAADLPAIAEVSGAPLDDTRALLQHLPGFDELAARAAQEQEEALFAAGHERGRLSRLAVWLAGWRTQPKARLAKIELCVFAGAHGWVCPSAQAIALAKLKTRLMLLSAGGSAANIQAGSMGAGVRVFDMAVDQPTGDATGADAMTELACARTVGFGLEAVLQQPDVLIVHALGSGGREVAAALAMGLFGGAPADWLAGAAMDLAEEFNQAAAKVTAMVTHSSRGAPDALERARRLGARELAAVAGAIIAARAQRIPVILDGFEATVAAAMLSRLAPGAIDHCLVAGRDGTAAHDRLIEALRLEPMLDMQIRGGDGLAGLMTAQLLQTAVMLHLDLANQRQVEQLLSDTPEVVH
jgi:nicotinate-nucleotide--dimethylbenzimidazole phosphoribosyltransferase